MMKNNIKKIINIFVVIGLFFCMFAPKHTSAQTLAGLRNDLKVLQNKKAEQDRKKQQTQAEINKNKNNIANAGNDIDKAKVQIEVLTNEINSTNEEIAKVKEQTEELLRQYQKMSEENEYAKYITGANSMTELIMRMDVMKQVAAYNDEQLTKLEALIKNNQKMSQELEEYQKTLQKKITTFEELIDSLGDDLSSLVEGAESIESEIKSKKESIKYYESAGCKEDEDLSVCVKIGDNSGWLRPLVRGKITSPFGWRIHPTKRGTKFHNGIDIGITEGTKAYATANGVVGKITRQASCGGNMVYIWVYVKGVKYTIVYMHLLTINVKVGDAVTTDTVVGLVGGGSTGTRRGGYDSCTTGAHLHYGVSKGNWYTYDKTQTYSKFTAGMMNPPGFPSLGSSFYTR